MPNLGILSDKETFQIEMNNLLKQKSYNLINVKDKEQLEILDGLIIYLNAKKNFSEVIEWLIFSQSIPNLFVWVFSSEELGREQIILFELGANDIFCSAESEKKLVYVIQNTFVCIGNGKEENNYISEDSFLDEQNQSMTVNGQQISLTRIEYRMLTILYENLKKTLTYEELFREIWGMEKCEEQAVRVANVIFHLRKKLERSERFEIKTTRSRGYMLKMK